VSASIQVAVIDSGSLGDITHDNADILDATVLDLREYLLPVFGAFATDTDPQAEDVSFTVHGDPNRHMDRPVSDLPVTYLYVYRVYEDHRVDAIEQPVLPFHQ
jgi:hypothetical protein